jgi:hypothetical protein
MPECEVCEESVETIYTCKGCGLLFCEDCGSASQRICIGCLEDEIDEEY